MRTHTQAPSTVTTQQAVWYATYEPRTMTRPTWEAIASAHAAIMLKTQFPGLQNFQNRCNDVAKYLAWRQAMDKDNNIQAAMTILEITDYHRHGPLSTRDRSKGESLSRLKTIARQVNPLVMLEEPPTIAHKAPMAAPYTPLEEVHIRRVSLRQRLPLSRMRMCLMVGMAGGAGVRSHEMRFVRDRHFEMVSDLYVIDIEGDFPRQVPVRPEYGDLIKGGLAEVRQGHKVLAPLTEHKNLTGKIVDSAEIMGNVPDISAHRLRNTWLTWLLGRPLPMQHVLTLAGLSDPRNLVDLVPYTNDTEISIEDAAGVTR